jgi:hypothetical protein
LTNQFFSVQSKKPSAEHAYSSKQRHTASATRSLPIFSNRVMISEPFSNCWDTRTFAQQ